jgi:hypothetical protein
MRLNVKMIKKLKEMPITKETASTHQHIHSEVF